MIAVSCRICNKRFNVKPSHLGYGWGKYCSIACRSKGQYKGKEVLCNVCGKKVHRAPNQLLKSKSGLFFCSKSCQTLWRNKYFIGERHANWISGASAYREILKRTGIKQVCKLCGISNSQVLTAHHLDHNRQNNDAGNLIWLCLNCHFMVHHDLKIDKGLQKGKILR